MAVTDRQETTSSMYSNHPSNFIQRFPGVEADQVILNQGNPVEYALHRMGVNVALVGQERAQELAEGWLARIENQRPVTEA